MLEGRERLDYDYEEHLEHASLAKQVLSSTNASKLDEAASVDFALGWVELGGVEQRLSKYLTPLFKLLTTR